MEKTMELDEFHPDWADKAATDETKPVWQDKIPHLLWQLGEVFFPIPPGVKGWNYPHHMQSKRYSADSEQLNGYFECGWGYGISCADSIAVVDIDEMEYIEEITDALPKTAYQWSGSREGVHLFYLVDGLEQRQNLRIRMSVEDHAHAEGLDRRQDPVRHIGEVKCDPHGYVIGPGSLHPSGNHYGPLKGDKIAKVEKDVLLEKLSKFIYQNDADSWEENYDYGESGSSTQHQFYELTADDVLGWLEPNKRIAHPIHGSDTGNNFMKNDDRETFTCWRCTYGIGQGCGINAQQLLALMELGNRLGDYACEEVRRNWRSDSTLHYHAWNKAIRDGLIKSTEIPYRVMKGYAVEEGVLSESDKISGDVYHDIRNSLEYKVHSVQVMPDM